ncbi:MAG TPA: UvrB/UvrC motif-containing protein [Ardenticatenaceae bacterium]|nr:UvrB/UvrC motif-containing protein [Ardenticatenaceae bacterium]
MSSGSGEEKFPSERSADRSPDRSTDRSPDRSSEKPEKSQPEQTERQQASKDIVPLLKGWDYEPGTINVRKIDGRDGKPKLQMRLDLGLLQMELTGRPDGAKPHGHDSLLEYYEEQLREHKKTNGSELGFHLTSNECQSLREEAAMYYHRYLSLFVLEEFNGVVRDTDRNLRLLDLCGKYALTQEDRIYLEQYRPYIIMMNVRAKASMLFNDKKWKQALEVVTEGLDSIREFFARFGQVEAFGKSNEVKILKKFARDIRKKLPVDPIQKLKAQLEKAVQREAYEDAARLRDEIRRQTEEVE